ncbi:hypothetical protein EVAR_80464_1 [Eumeta japonica]|uniref:Uncharacterized protein n=1 Tax=Eumeta variegata TaxID=151549 RepID=A0A4C1VGD1_EUMVA|nr:hypothetical protein EVAR_80464_1 [Eumeta japonica]
MAQRDLIPGGGIMLGIFYFNDFCTYLTVLGRLNGDDVEMTMAALTNDLGSLAKGFAQELEIAVIIRFAQRQVHNMS